MTWEREPVVENTNRRPPHGVTWAISDARVAAALQFAGALYHGKAAMPDHAQEVEERAIRFAKLALGLFEGRS